MLGEVIPSEANMDGMLCALLLVLPPVDAPVLVARPSSPRLRSITTGCLAPSAGREGECEAPDSGSGTDEAFQQIQIHCLV